MSLTIPSDFRYTLLGLLSPVFVNIAQLIIVSKNRKAAKVPYPYLYAEKAECENSPAAKKFNCAQRAHQNTLEAMPSFIITALITGLRYPKFAAAASVAWSIGRIGYTLGYLKSPEKRVNGVYRIGALGQIGLIFASIYTVGVLIWEGSV